MGIFWYLCFCPHHSRDSVSPVCGICLPYSSLATIQDFLSPCSLGLIKGETIKFVPASYGCSGKRASGTRKAIYSLQCILFTYNIVQCTVYTLHYTLYSRVVLTQFHQFRRTKLFTDFPQNLSDFAHFIFFYFFSSLCCAN